MTIRDRGSIMEISNRPDQYLEDDQLDKTAIEASPVAVRSDLGKDPWHLFMWDAAQQVVKVLHMGAAKYTARNWEKGMDWSRCYSSAQRHMIKWWQLREDNDKESGLNHLAHAAWNILALLAYQLRGGIHKANDDRPSTYISMEIEQ